MEADNSLIAAGSAILIAVGLPIFMKWMENRNAASILKAKEDREDELSNRVVRATELVAAKVEEKAQEAARLLLAANAEIVKAREVQAAALKEISDTGKTTHALVNNNLTVSKKQGRDGYTIALASLERSTCQRSQSS